MLACDDVIGMQSGEKEKLQRQRQLTFFRVFFCDLIFQENKLNLLTLMKC